MLVLTLKAGQCVVIDRSIVITVLDSRPGRIRLGIQAPPEVAVWRAEIQERPTARSEAPAALITAPDSSVAIALPVGG